MPSIYLSSVLLERNRWTTDQLPSIPVSEYLSFIREAGFDGVELWQNHFLEASEFERNSLNQCKCFIPIFNSYVGFDHDSADERVTVANAIQSLNCSFVKFNLGPNHQDIPTYISTLKEWIGNIPEECTLLCECHPGTVMEDPFVAKSILDQLSNKSIHLILHPLHKETEISSWFKLFGNAISHMHVSLFDGSHFHCLRHQSPYVRERLNQLNACSFNGTYSIEFTKGVAEDQETVSDLLQHAREDLTFLRQYFDEQGESQ